jgi:protoporphyrinogen oxidase
MMQPVAGAAAIRPPASVPTAILGAGLAGLACAYHIREAAHVFEREAVVGGSARSVTRGGYTFDITGHWLHFKDPQLRAWVTGLMGDDLVGIVRRAGVYSHGVQTPYPFQAHTYGLPKHVVAECLLGFFAARERRAAGNLPPCHSFEDYIRQCMGDGIAEHFMLPYNTKLWTVPPKEMAYAWCGRFVPLPDPEAVVWGALQPGGAGASMGYNARFLYPRQGGIGAVATAIAAQVPHAITLNATATEVDWRRRKVTFADGHNVHYRTLVSTLPLTRLLQSMVDVPTAVLQAAAVLRANQVTWWDVGLARPTPDDACHWVYYPEKALPFFRVGCPSAVWPALAPAGRMSLSVEVAHGPKQACPVDTATMLAGLKEVGWLGPNEVPELCERSTLDCAYTIMDHAYGAAREVVLAWLASEDIISIGRFGAWMYDSMEGALAAGKAAAEAISQRDGAQAP